MCLVLSCNMPDGIVAMFNKDEWKTVHLLDSEGRLAGVPRPPDSVSKEE